jgi:hypothetical protein
LQPNYDQTIAFLQILYPTGPWMLTAISVDKKAIDTHTFHISDTGEIDTREVLGWLEYHRKRNLYYSVNEPIVAAYDSKKLRKSDIRAAHYLHVDIDPRAGEDLEAEQTRIAARVAGYRVKPTLVVFSGGGYNVLWKLDRPVPIADGVSIDESVLRASDFERYNWQLELDFDTPDHCRDVCRILRLPGTINYPTEEKRKKYGRYNETTAVLVSSDASAVYPLEHFRATPLVATNATTTRTSVRADIIRTDSLEKLGLDDDLQVLIIQGGHEVKHQQKYKGDRSAALFAACCGMVRAGLEDAVILGIITDRRYVISESVLDKGSGQSRYAIRQVQRARDQNAESGDQLMEMNEQFAVIQNYGNAARILNEYTIDATTRRREPTFMRERDFHSAFANLPPVPVGEKKMMDATRWWMRNPRRRTYVGVMFEPGIELEGHYNLWSGFGVQPTPGDRHLRFLEHCHEVLCAGNDEHYDYLIKWLARSVQTPRTRSEATIVLLGERGTGKSFFCNFIKEIFNPHTHTMSDTNALTGRFNAHLSQCLLAIAEEAFDLRNVRHESILKSIITDETLSVEYKGVDRIQMPNYTHLIMTSNHDRVVPAGNHERRFFVLQVSNKHMQDTEWFLSLDADQKAGGPAHLLHYLMQIDLSKFNVRRPPITEALLRQQRHNLAQEGLWLLHRLQTGQWGDFHRGDWTGPVEKEELYREYIRAMEFVKNRSPLGHIAFYDFMKQELNAKSYQTRMADGKRPYVFLFPPLAECQAMWKKNHGWVNHTWEEYTTAVFDEGVLSPIKTVF